MTEKINGQGFRPADAGGTRRSEAAKPATAGQSRSTTGSASAPTSDKVSITQSGLLMSKLEELVQRAPIVDQERIAAIKDAIASGTYEIDDQRVADRMLKLERDVFG